MSHSRHEDSRSAISGACAGPCAITPGATLRVCYLMMRTLVSEVWPLDFSESRRVVSYVRCLADEATPSQHYTFPWSLPLALKLGERLMSTSMVTISRSCAITRPASRVDDNAEAWYGVYAFAFRNINIEIIGLKSKHLLVKQIK